MYYNNLFIDTNLKEPLEQSKLYDYFEKYKSGILNARKIIIEHNMRLVISIVKTKYRNTLYDEKELVSIGMIGLIKAVDTFDTSRKIKFATYATRCIRNEIGMFIRKGKKYINDESLDETLNIDEKGKKIKIEDKLCDETIDFVSDYEKLETRAIIRRVVDDLPDRERKIIILYFYYQLTQDEIADEINISQSQVSRLKAKILKKISLQLKEEGIIEREYRGKVKYKKNISNKS